MNDLPQTTPAECEPKSWHEKGALALKQNLSTSWLFEIDPLKPAWLFISLIVHGLLFFLLTRI